MVSFRWNSSMHFIEIGKSKEKIGQTIKSPGCYRQQTDIILKVLFDMKRIDQHNESPVRRIYQKLCVIWDINATWRIRGPVLVHNMWWTHSASVYFWLSEMSNVKTCHLYQEKMPVMFCRRKRKEFSRDPFTRALIFNNFAC